MPKSMEPRRPTARPKLELISTPKVIDPIEAVNPVIESLRKTPKWEVLNRLWDLADEHAKLAFLLPRPGEERLTGAPFTPLEDDYVRRQDELRDKWRDLVMELAEITVEEWHAFVDFQS